MVKKRHRLWNLVLTLTVIVCSLALLAHYKNWTRIRSDGVQILSGFYYRNLKYSDLDSVQLVAKIPPMERLNGFSALEREKGIFREFKDSLTDKKVPVFVDNLANQKIKVVYQDSLKLFINFKDATKTEYMYHFLLDKIKEQNK